MKRVFRWIVPLLILLLLGLPANAQFGAQDVIVLQPFAIESFDLQGLRPAGWRENQPDSGVYLRFRDPTDRTAIMMQSIEADAQTMLERLQTTFNLAELPAIAETIEANNLSWNLYEFTHQQGNLTLFGALALTQNDERTYFVLMQTVEVFYENLHETLFLPVVQSISPIQRYEDPEERFSFPIPPTWVLETADGYALVNNPDDSIRLIISAVESDDAAAAMTALWQQYNPDFALTYAEENMRVVDDPAQLRGLDRVTIIDWLDTEADSTVLRQGVAREFDGVQYIILIEGEGAAIERENAAYSMVDSGLQIEALTRAIEATEDAASS